MRCYDGFDSSSYISVFKGKNHPKHSINLSPYFGFLKSVLLHCFTSNRQTTRTDNIETDSSFFTYLGAISLKRMRRFDQPTTDLG